MDYSGGPYYWGGLASKSGSLIAKALPKSGNRVYTVETPPAIEPVTLDELKAFSRIGYTSEDILLEGFITAARMAAEEYTGRAFITQTIRMEMDYWPGTVIDLPKPPLISVTEVMTVDEDDEETEYDSDNYYVITTSTPGRLILKQSVVGPVNTARNYGGFLIRYKVGYSNFRDDIPGPIKEGIKVWASIIQATRTIDPKNPPPEAAIFLDLYRIVGVTIR